MSRTRIALALCAALLALPAIGLAAKAAKPPEIGATSYSKGETAGTVVVEVDVFDASKVTAAIGRKGARKRIELTETKHRGGEATWSGEVAEYKEQCAPVTFVARNAAGKTEQVENKVCVFAPAEDDPAVDTPPGLPI